MYLNLHSALAPKQFQLKCISQSWPVSSFYRVLMLPLCAKVRGRWVLQKRKRPADKDRRRQQTKQTQKDKTHKSYICIGVCVWVCVCGEQITHLKCSPNDRKRVIFTNFKLRFYVSSCFFFRRSLSVALGTWGCVCVPCVCVCLYSSCH